MPPPSPASSHGGEPEEDFSETMFRVSVQFKWGRSGDFLALCPYGLGDCVVVRGEVSGEDLGMVAECTMLEPSQARPVRPVLRVAAEKEERAWRGPLVERERMALRTAVRCLPENKVGFRVVHASFQFDMSVLMLFYTTTSPLQNMAQHASVMRQMYGGNTFVVFKPYDLMKQDALNRKLLKEIQAGAEALPPQRPVSHYGRADGYDMSGRTDPVSPQQYVNRAPLRMPKRTIVAHSRGASFDSVGSGGSCALSSLASEDFAQH